MKRIHPLAAPLRALLSSLVLGACALQMSPAFGQATPTPPERMTYQGFLVGADGVALGNTSPKNYDVIFTIYPAQSGGAALWSEQQTVTVDKGYFSVLLGEGSANGVRPNLSTIFLGATASDRYVATTVKGIGAGGANVDILPRLRLLTSPYSFLAQQAVKLVQTTGPDLLTSSGNVMTLNGSLDVTSGQSIELGSNVAGKQSDAGRIGYALFSTGLDIVGAGTLGNNRKITMWAEGGLTVTGPVSASSFTGSGSGLTGVAKLGANTFVGNQYINAGNLQFDNSYRIQAKNSAGTMEEFLYPRWSDNVTYLNYGSGGFNIRNNASASTMFLGNDNRVTFQAGVLARGGYPGAGGANNNGYAFSGNGGDNDSGMFSDLDGHVRFTSNSDLKLSVYPGGVYAHAPLTAGSDLTVNTGWGQTFTVNGNTASIFMADNKSKYSSWWRQDNGMVFGTVGGTSQGGAATRYCVYDGDSNWDFSSDRKLKQDIVDAESMLDRALHVQIRRFRWKGETSEAKLHMGVIAQELQPLFPDMIGHVEDPVTKENSLTVGYSDFGMIAVKALQEFKKQHDSEVADLKAQLAELKAQMTAVLQAIPQNGAQPVKSKQTVSVGR